MVFKLKFSIVLFLELFCLMPYQYIKLLGSVYDITVYLKCLFFAGELILYFRDAIRKNNNVIRLSYTGLALLVYLFYSWVNSVFKGSVSVFNISVFVISIIMIALSLRRNLTYNHQVTFNTISVFFGVAILFNFISLIAFPNGLYVTYGMLHIPINNYFLGLDNAFGIYMFPGAMFICYTEEMFGKRHLCSYIVLLVVLSTYIITMSGAGLLASFTMILLYVIYRSGLFASLFNMKTIALIIMIISLGLIMGNSLIYENNFFANFVTEKLNKDITFSGRMEIWNRATQQMLDSPITGFGMSAAGNVVRFQGRYRIAHNFLLHMMLEGGIIGLLLFCVFVNRTSTDTRKTDDKRVRILYIGIFSTLVYALMESGTSITIGIFVMLLVLGYSRLSEQERRT